MQFGVATEAETYYTLASPCGFYCKIKIEHFSASTFSVTRTHAHTKNKIALKFGDPKAYYRIFSDILEQ